VEVGPGIHRIESKTSDQRLLCCYLLRGDVSVLVDTGDVNTPPDAIWPYLSASGVDCSSIRVVVVTHADADHFGGASGVLDRTPALIGAHEADARWIADPELAMTERYGQFESSHRIAYSPEARTRIRAQLGDAVPVTLRLTEGDALSLRAESRWQVVYLPGHTPGQLGLFEPRSGVAVIGDAALGDGLRDRTGRIVIPPSYYNPVQYLETLTKIEQLVPRILLTGHLPILSGEAIDQLLTTSRLFVDELENTLRRIIGQKRDPWSLVDVTEDVRQTLGPWSPGILPGLARSVLGHVLELERQGAIAPIDEYGDTPHWRALAAL